MWTLHGKHRWWWGVVIFIMGVYVFRNEWPLYVYWLYTMFVCEIKYYDNDSSWVFGVVCRPLDPNTMSFSENWLLGLIIYQIWRYIMGYYDFLSWISFEIIWSSIMISNCLLPMDIFQNKISKVPKFGRAFVNLLWRIFRTPQQTDYAIMTSLFRQNESFWRDYVKMTMFWRYNIVVITSCVQWVTHGHFLFPCPVFFRNGYERCSRHGPLTRYVK